MASLLLNLHNSSGGEGRKADISRGFASRKQCSKKKDCELAHFFSFSPPALSLARTRTVAEEIPCNQHEEARRATSRFWIFHFLARKKTRASAHRALATARANKLQQEEKGGEERDYAKREEALRATDVSLWRLSSRLHSWLAAREEIDFAMAESRDPLREQTRHATEAGRRRFLWRAEGAWNGSAAKQRTLRRRGAVRCTREGHADPTIR